MAKNPKTILVTDDSPATQEISKKLLENSGYVVVSAWEAEEALKLAVELVPDLILMDVILPDGDGKSVAQELYNNPQTKNIPIIFTTNTLSSQEDKGYAAINVDGRDYRAFAKPLHGQKIISVIRKEINRSIYGGKLPKEIERNKE